MLCLLPPAAANRELIPSWLSFLLGKEAEALEGAGIRSFRELRQDRWGKLCRTGQASAVSSCCRCASLLGCLEAPFPPWGQMLGPALGKRVRPATSLTSDSHISETEVSEAFFVLFPQVQGMFQAPLTLAWNRSPWEGPSGRGQGCGFGWGWRPLLRAQHLEAIRPWTRGGVAGEGRGGGIPPPGHTQAHPLGSSGIGPFHCWLPSPSPHCLAAASAACANVVHSMRGPQFLIQSHLPPWSGSG